MMTMYVSPYRRINSLRQVMDRLLDESLSDTNAAEREMNLAMDVRAEEDAYVITALVPGLEADDLGIEILNNTVTLRGEFKAWASEEPQYLLHELPLGRFVRTVTLPVELDTTRTEASIRNGVLTLRLAKAEAHRPKTVKVVAVA